MKFGRAFWLSVYTVSWIALVVSFVKDWSMWYSVVLAALGVTSMAAADAKPRKD